MTRSGNSTPIPIAIPFEFRLICDSCGNSTFYDSDEEEYPVGWREVILPGWVGSFHACSDECVKCIELKIQKDLNLKLQ